MNILIYSYFTPRKQHLAGGAQRFLHDLIIGLVDGGEKITVLSPEADESDILRLGSRLTVMSTLREAQNRSLTPYERHYNAQYYAKLAQNADIVLSIDRSVPVETETPVLLSLNNFSYSTEVESVFGLRWDSIVVPSLYLHRCVESIVGPAHWSNGSKPIHIIPLPVDTNCFQPTDCSSLAQRLEIDDSQRVIVFPHRPDPGKGFELALEALEIACRRDPGILLLVPCAPDSVLAVQQRERAYIEKIKYEVALRGLGNNVRFHSWIHANDMPAYLSLAKYCLTLSTLPEGFGLSVLQSIACLTPVITTLAGAIKDLLPPSHGVMEVPFNSPSIVANALLQTLNFKEVQRGRKYIQENYDVTRVVNRYIELLPTIKRSYANYHPQVNEPDLFGPWCRMIDSESVWHDYEKKYLSGDEMREVTSIIEKGKTSDRNRELYLKRGLIVGRIT